MERVTKNNRLLPRARELRREMTPQERHLWYDFLRYYPVKIYKQRIIDHFIADFYCKAARLVIELDGSQHFTQEGLERDTARTEVIERYQLLVIRFTNYEVDTQFEAVCEQIRTTIEKRIALFPQTPETKVERYADEPVHPSRYE